ncbi:calphotin isoform X2 [Danaus plexippus]|uniref:calphotin isoform X2 n=1 Tax=Danaus plexippus TaxID=13037 RepID=UPI002AB14F95|nr:calphotin isoform X2 [Danaus plexippus]
MSNRAWVTLATNDSYGLGALVLAHSLRRASSSYPAVVLITPSVTEPMRERLRAVFAEVILVDVLDSKDAAHLALLQRPELGITFTKIHCWNLTQYEKCVFLDADTLIVQNCDELFEREELSAAPDVGWPDCFNSGVFVFKPSADTFSKLVTFASERGSFDGGDQGLLNSYFSDWARGDINKHLPFLYNVTSAAFYSYIPALKHYGQNLKIIHFIGAAKPWLQHFNWQSRSVEAPEHLRGFLQLWWDLFVAQVHSQLDTQMTGVAGNLAKVVPGEPQQQEAVDELTRRQGWEAGNIDYMGADSFDNIWAKISQTLSQPPSSPPRQPSPSNDQSVQPSEDRAVAIGEAKEAVVAPVESKPEEPVKGSIPSDASSETPVAVEAPVMASEVDASTASTETVENVVSLDAAETVAPTETSESVPPPEAPACVSLPVASDCVSSPEVPATVDATEPVVQIEAEATESVSPPEASKPVAQIEATESVSPPEASEHVAQIEATESVSPPEASEHVAQIEATCVSSPQPSENIPIVESKETVAPPVADVNVASTEVLENVSAPATPVAPAESIDSLTVPEPPAPATENKDDVVPETSPAAASIEEPVVDVPVPASEAAESPGKQEDPIPVPAEIAAIPKSMPDESQTEMEPSGDIPVTAEEAIKIDIACVPKSSEMPAVDEQSDSPLNKSLATNEQSSDKKEVASDSPPLANTPSKEEIPSPPAAKTEERRKPLGKLSLPPAACDTLPTPDSELEDAASLAHAIIAGELRTPTVTSPSPPVISSSPQTQPSQTQARSLSIDQPEAPTPPLDSPLSLSQIGVKSKPTIASQIETSVSKTESAPTSEVSEAPKPKSDAPKKKIVKKVVKKVEKEGGASGDAPVPVPPPRKKEKKPKEK